MGGAVCPQWGFPMAAASDNLCCRAPGVPDMSNQPQALPTPMPKPIQALLLLPFAVGSFAPFLGGCLLAFGAAVALLWWVKVAILDVLLP